MIGVIEYKADAKSPAIPVGVGNTRVNSRNIIVEAVRTLSTPKRDGELLPVKTESVYFTQKGVMSQSDLNWNVIRYGYLRFAEQVLTHQNRNQAEISNYSVRTFGTIAEFAAYMKAAGLAFVTNSPIVVEPTTPEIVLPEGEYTMADLLALAAKAGESTPVADVKVKIGQAAKNKSTVALDDKELRAAFRAIVNNLPIASVDTLFKANSPFKGRVDQLAQAVDIKSPSTNFKVIATSK